MRGWRSNHAAHSYDRREYDERGSKVERAERERERERAEPSAAAGRKHRAAAALGSYHPLPHAHGGGGQNPFAALRAANGYPTQRQVYGHQSGQAHGQRAAPTLVIPRFSSATSTPQQVRGHAHSTFTTSNANANYASDPNSNTTSYASTTVTSSATYTSASSSSSSGGGRQIPERDWIPAQRGPALAFAGTALHGIPQPDWDAGFERCRSRAVV
ncbi:hypothetical protein B0H16DRAFT_1026872 [Mycena metata]|uniref:Uncharacterized protein n=1 Tax=Mycena metata TaxID=1033252 RepID=A0AAD7N2X8_9AGAR|nr:hypothetical protein B0H16DRAFT_1026872 [Mycena metata]